MPSAFTFSPPLPYLHFTSSQCEAFHLPLNPASESPDFIFQFATNYLYYLFCWSIDTRATVNIFFTFKCICLSMVCSVCLFVFLLQFSSYSGHSGTTYYWTFIFYQPLLYLGTLTSDLFQVTAAAVISSGALLKLYTSSRLHPGTPVVFPGEITVRTHLLWPQLLHPLFPMWCPVHRRDRA